MKQLSLAAFYLQRPSELDVFVEEVRKILLKSLGDNFKPYPLSQIHATLIGLEKTSHSTGIFSLNMYNAKNQLEQMDFSGFLEYLKAWQGLDIRLGGFSKEFSSFLSADKPPFERMFHINAKTGKVVLMGWPFAFVGGKANELPNNKLWSFRKACSDRFSIRHKYHSGQDNDFFLVLGDLVNAESFLKKDLENISNSIRNWMNQNPIHFSVEINDLKFVSYSDTNLPTGNTNYYTVNELLSRRSLNWKIFYQ